VRAFTTGEKRLILFLQQKPRKGNLKKGQNCKYVTRDEIRSEHLDLARNVGNTIAHIMAERRGAQVLLVGGMKGQLVKNKRREKPSPAEEKAITFG